MTAYSLAKEDNREKVIAWLSQVLPEALVRESRWVELRFEVGALATATVAVFQRLPSGEVVEVPIVFREVEEGGGDEDR